MYYLLLIVASMLLVTECALNKIYQGIYGTAPKVVFLYSSITGILTGIIFFIINEFKIDFSLYSFIMAGLYNSIVIANTVIAFKFLKTGTMAMYSMFLLTGGMVLPYIWGLFFLKEEFSILRTVVLFVILADIILLNYGDKKVSAKQIGMCLTVFVLNGCASIISKMHQSQTAYRVVNTQEFMILGCIFRFVIAGLLFLIIKNDKHSDIKAVSPKKGVIIIALAAAVGGGSFMLQLLGAKALPATVLYPFITGGSIVFSSVADVIIFKDKLSLKLVISIIVCFVGTLLLL